MNWERCVSTLPTPDMPPSALGYAERADPRAVRISEPAALFTLVAVTPQLIEKWSSSTSRNAGWDSSSDIPSIPALTRVHRADAQSDGGIPQVGRVARGRECRPAADCKKY